MPRTGRCLLVVSVISGRNFIDKPTANIVVEAKLDHEILATDPVPLVPSPQFEQELAWEVARSALKQYRLQRTSIKLLIFTVDGNSSLNSRDTVGYIILDVRSITEHKFFKWFQVLNSKLRPAPEIYCGLYIDQFSSSSPKSSANLNSTPLMMQHFVENFENQLIEGFQIGDTNSAQECLLISIGFVSVPQFANLLPPKVSSDSRFKLTLRFFDTDLFGWDFKEDDCTKLIEDHCKFLIRSTKEVIRECFSKANLFEVLLFMDQTQIGYCQENLQKLTELMDSNANYPLSVEVPFTLHSSQVGCSDTPVVFRFILSKYNLQLHDNPPTSPIKEKRHFSNGFNPPRTTNISSDLGQIRTCQNSTSETIPSEQPVTSKTTAPQLPTNYVNDSVQLHRFCYVIELKTIRACHEPPPSKEFYVYAKYVYPLFGTTNPIMTLPPVRFSSKEAGHFSQGYCAFELAAEFLEFRSRLIEEPLRVEILSRSPEITGELEPSFGWATIPLGEVFSKPPIEMANSRRRLMEGVVDAKLNGKPMAEITYSLVLDDFGVYNSSTATEITSLNQTEGVNTSSAEAIVENEKKVPADIRQTSEYRTALELELWKAKEEERFKNDLKLREQKMLVLFAEEWKRREDERESLCKKKMQEYQMLEDKLRAVLEVLIEREKQLNIQETFLKAAERDLERNLEMREKSMLKDVQLKIGDAEKALGAEKMRNSQLSSELTFLREKCQGLEERLFDQQSKAAAAARVNGTATDAKCESGQAKRDEDEIRRLQFELVRLTTELTGAQSQLSSMERRLEGALRGRLRYKELWTRALQEVTLLREEAANANKQELQRKQAEVEGLRREQSLLRSGDTRNCPHQNKPVQQIAAESQRLEGIVLGKAEDALLQSSANSQQVNDPALDSHLRRLREERECLLASGAYYEDDELIIHLENEIKRLQVVASNAA